MSQQTTTLTANQWQPLLQTTLPQTPTILLGLTPGTGPARLSASDLARRRQAPDARNRDQDPFLRSIIPQRVIVSRERGEKAARQLGAQAYVECSEENVLGLERLWGIVMGVAAARRLNAEVEAAQVIGVAL